MFEIFPNDADAEQCTHLKFGIDPTFNRLHLGHFVPLRQAIKWLDQGKKVTIILGTFTAQLGDPSGRDSTRPILSAEEVHANADDILSQIVKVTERNCQLLTDGNLSIRRNSDWLDKLTLPHFLRIVSDFTLSHLTSRNAFQQRIAAKNPIAIHELLVPICQGWDSVVLGNDLELGGQDQLFNFQMARQLQEKNGQKPQACMMMPIIRGTDGLKMSKSLKNCIFLDEQPNEMFGQIMSIPDDVMNEWLPLLTDLTALVPQGNRLRAADLPEHPMQKKKLLAFDITKQLHGEDAAATAQKFFEATVQQAELPPDIPTIQATEIVDALTQLVGCSRSAARQLIRGGGVSVDGVKIESEIFTLSSGQLVKGGKRLFARIQ